MSSDSDFEFSKLPELQQAIRGLSGVAAATVRWPEPEGPATLRVEFASDADREELTQAVLEALRTVGGVAPDTIEVRQASVVAAPAANGAVEDRVAADVASPPAEEPAAERRRDVVRVAEAVSDSQPVRRSDRNGHSRPLFAGLAVDSGQLDTVVQVTLQAGERRIIGRAEGLATQADATRAAAAATLTALREFLGDDVRVHLERLEIVGGTPGQPGIMECVVTCLTSEGEQVFVGSALIRDDPKVAAVRATLDALNRRLELLARE